MGLNMSNKYNNTVILSKGGEHGKRVIHWWKEQGVDVMGYEGVDEGWYYGLVGKRFGTFYECPSSAKIIELPESNPKDLINRKVRGFKFNAHFYVDKMDNYLGEVGIITGVDSAMCKVQFKDDYFFYPTSLIHYHLVEEVQSQIIDLSNVEGVEMMVSFNEIDYVKRNVVAKCNARHIDSYGDWWLFAKPIEQVKKVTMQEVEKLFGCKVEIVKEVGND